MAFNLYMHERNIYRNQPDFTQIALDFPAFRKYAVPDATGKKVFVDFSNPDALRMVTEILLKKDFNLDVEIPQGYLIPTVPQRLNYILWLEDLLNNFPQKKKFARGIDIGTGPCAIFSILGARKNNWNFIATETSDHAIQWAKKNISKNNLDDNIKIVKVSPDTTLSEVLSSNEENYDFCLCNPPFFENIEEIRKKHHNSKGTIADVAQKDEIFFNGGELNFVKNILSDSLTYKHRISLFTSMFGKKKNFLHILKEIKELKDAKVTTTEFCQGNTIRWGIAWTFDGTVLFEKVDRKIKAQKAKPPLEYQIPLKNSKDFDLHMLLQNTRSFLTSIQIPVTVTRSSQYFAELLLKADENTWSHQRRKRREMLRQQKEASDLKNSHSATASDLPQVEETALDSEGISKPKIVASDINESKISRGNNATISKIDSEIISCESVTSSECSNETSQETNKIKELCHDNLPKNKKPRLDASLKSENSVYSEENTSIKLESAENDYKESYVLQTTDTLSKIESNVENSQTTSQITLDNYKILASSSLSSKNDSEKSVFESQVEENLKTKQKNFSSLEENESKPSTDKSKTDSLIFGTKKCEEIDDVCLTEKSNSSNDNKTVDNSKTLQNKQNQDVSVKSLSVHRANELHSKGKEENLSTQQGSLLHCHLQLIKGKNKVYVKMNCPPSANRNTMYQVFQLIKNKIK